MFLSTLLRMLHQFPLELGEKTVQFLGPLGSGLPCAAESIYSEEMGKLILTSLITLILTLAFLLLASCVLPGPKPAEELKPQIHIHYYKCTPPETSEPEPEEATAV